MSGEVVDPLLLGQRVVGSSRRAAHGDVQVGDVDGAGRALHRELARAAWRRAPGAIPELAHRVLETYWRQVRPFDGHDLRQSTQPRARILIATNQLRAAAGRATGSVDIARPSRADRYQSRSTTSRCALRNSRCIACRNCPAHRLATRSCTTTCSCTIMSLDRRCAHMETRSNSNPEWPMGSLG